MSWHQKGHPFLQNNYCFDEISLFQKVDVVAFDKKAIDILSFDIEM